MAWPRRWALAAAAAGAAALAAGAGARPDDRHAVERGLSEVQGDEGAGDETGFGGLTEQEWQAARCTGEEVLMKLALCACGLGLLDALYVACAFAFGKVTYSLVSAMGKPDFSLEETYVPMLKACLSLPTFLAVVLAVLTYNFRKACFTWPEAMSISALSFLTLLAFQCVCVACSACHSLRRNLITLLVMVGMMSAVDYAAMEAADARRTSDV